MCRYVAYLGQPLPLADLIYRPEHSLILQASQAVESPTHINADGFGVGWYNHALDFEPAVFKDISPAWNNANLRSIAGRVSSTCIMAHVRAARGNDPISRANCHPFDYGALLWMHNGDIPGRGRLHRRVAADVEDALAARIRGNTDTELAFALFLSFLAEKRDEVSTAPMMARALRRTIERVHGWWLSDGDDRPLALNFCVTNGRSMVATRFARGADVTPSLHYGVGSRYVCEGGTCRMNGPDGPGRCVVVASETLSDDPQWIDIDEDRIVLVRQDLSVEIESLSPVVA